MWYVKAAGGVWGPYPEARVAGFVAEARVKPDTLVSPWADGPFAPAADNAEFALLFQPATLAPVPPAAPSPAPRAAPERGVRTIAPATAAAAAQVQIAEPDALIPAAAAGEGPVRALLVWAQLSSRSAQGFHAALAATGPGVAIRPGLWLVQARTGASSLRNLLSRRLGETDALMVVEAPLDQAAWFNLDPARDRELRRLWAASGPT